MKEDQDDVAVDLSDPQRATGPYGIAKSCEEKIARLEAAKQGAPRSKREAMSRQIHELRDLMDWCKTRAGYVEPNDTPSA